MLFYWLFLHVFCNLLLALGLNTCLKAVQTIATYIEVIKSLSGAKDVFVFSKVYLRHFCSRDYTENTPLGSRMKWRMESTSGLIPSKTLLSK